LAGRLGRAEPADGRWQSASVRCGERSDSRVIPKEKTKMAHVLDGLWRSIAFNGDEPKNDGSFSLTVNAGNSLERSQHDGNGVSGDVTNGGLHLHIVEVNEGRRREYIGDLVLQFPAQGGKKVHVIVGTRTLFSTKVDPRDKSKLTQEEGTWVATKQG
jgi:hypothetical protein